MTTKPSSIQTVHNIGKLLRCFTEAEGELGVMEISRALGMHKSTVSRLLSSLSQEGLVAKNPQSGKYQLGLGLVHLAGVVLDRLDLGAAAQPFIRKLAVQTGETINIAVIDQKMCMNIGSALSHQPIQYAGRLGRRYPLPPTATGRVLLAGLSPEEKEDYLRSPLQALTEKTITNRKNLNSIIEGVKEQGYAIVHEEFQEGLSAIAAPIYDYTGSVIAAISISAPTFRLGPGQIEQYIDILQDTANKLSSQLGNGMF